VNVNDRPFDSEDDDAIARGGIAVSAEHRFLSVLFCDVVNSSGHLYSMDAEAFSALLARYTRLVHAAVRRHGGTVARVVGDGVLAYFGWPRTAGRDAQAAVACGLEIAAAMPGLQNAQEVMVRVAVETGWVLVGEIDANQGPEKNVEQWAAVGPAPYVAARLQQIARPNGVIVGEETLQLLGGRFATEPADTSGIKLPVSIVAAHVLREVGAAEPLARLRPRRAQRELGQPLIGRDRELAAMRGRWDAAVRGQGQVILVSGEPGMGKSRLLGALLEDIGLARGVVALFCSPAARDNPFQPIVEPLRLAIGLASNAAPDTIRAQVAEFTRHLGLDDPRCALALATLQGAPSPDPPPPAELRRHIKDALLAVAGKLVLQQPLLVLAEDVHWADASTLEFLRGLGDWVQANRMLLLITYRSDHVLPWADRPHVLRLSLGPLSNAASHRLASELALEQGVELDDGQRSAIVGRAEGIPLFIEEFVRALADREAPVSRLPGSIAQLMVARLDSLGVARHVAQLASVVGQEARVDLLQTLSDMGDTPFEEAVGRLTESGVMTRRGVGREAVLAFRHALLGDAAYQALPTPRRRVLHDRVASTLLQLMPSLAQTDPEVVAHHMAEAGHDGEAAVLYGQAASAALTAAAFVEAEARARRALSLAEALPDAARAPALLAALLPLGEALIATRGEADTEVQEVHERGATLALGMGTAQEILPFLRGLNAFYIVRGPLLRAHQLGERVLQIARKVASPMHVAQAERRHGWCMMCRGDLMGARTLLEASLARHIAAEAGSADGKVASLAFDDAYTLAHLAWLDWLTEGAEAALARTELAAARAELAPRPLTTAYSLGICAMVHQMAGDRDGAARLAERCAAISSDRGFTYWIAMSEALRHWARAVRKHPAADALDGLQAALVSYQRTQSLIFRPYVLALLAEAKHAAGSSAAALEALDRANRVAVGIGARLYAPTLLRTRGHVLLAAGDAEGAHRAIQASHAEALALGATALAGICAAEMREGPRGGA
jgi:class 3 adenylate cyclase/tetratricopeptide (TPR) repeat protein